MEQETKKVFFPYDSNKATQAVLWLLQNHRGDLNKVKLVKLLFLADKEHLRLFGRPIVGGQYYAMPHGPASSELLNHINEASQVGLYPFALEGNRVLSQMPADKDELSESDIEVLNTINCKYGCFHWWYLRDLTHLLTEYIENWGRKSEGSKRHSIPYEDLFKEEKDKAMLGIVRDEQEAWADFT